MRHDDDDNGDERDQRWVDFYDDEALQLMQGWWGGQNDPIYAIASSGGNYAWVFVDAIYNLDRDISRVKKLGRNKFQLGNGTFTKKEIDELHTIRQALAYALYEVTGKMEEAGRDPRARFARPSRSSRGAPAPRPRAAKREFHIGQDVEMISNPTNMGHVVGFDPDGSVMVQWSGSRVVTGVAPNNLRVIGRGYAGPRMEARGARPLISSQDTPKAERIIRSAAAARFGRGRADLFFEHGHWWATVGDRTYDVVDAIPGVGGLGIDFEEIG